MSLTRFLFVALLASGLQAQAAIPGVPEIPQMLPDGVRQPLIARRQPLAQLKLGLVDEGSAINRTCVNLERGSAAYLSCLGRQKKFNDDVAALTVLMDRLASDIDSIVEKYTIEYLNAFAKRQEWSLEKRGRVAGALRSLRADGDSNATDVQIRAAWRDVLARGTDSEVARRAVQGDGPGFPGAGTQSFEDCAVFALANATGRPYGFVAGMAAELISKGEWREPADRANPQKAIEEGGLTGGEVILLAETFGQAEVIRSTDFARTLREGRTVMVNVVPQSGDVSSGHEVVLTKAFQHDGQTWYAMMDSNQGPQRRLYLSARELSTIQQESGVAFRPEPGTVPRPLR